MQSSSFAESHRYCVVLDDGSRDVLQRTAFDLATGWRFDSREAAEGCCEALNWLLGHTRFRVAFGPECEPAALVM